MVVYTCVPMDVYQYKILSSPIPEDIGTFFVVNVPRSPIFSSAEVNYFNSHCNGVINIDSSILKHTIGEPDTYPTIEDQTAIETLNNNSAGFYTPLSYGVNVGAGAGTFTSNIEQMHSYGSSYDFNLNVGFTAETTAGYAVLNISAAFHYGWSTTLTMSSSVFVEGCVGNISTDDFSPLKSFTWGLMSYPYSDTASGQKFTVVTYWVQ